MTMPATMAEAASAMRAGRLSATDLLEFSLEAIAAHNEGTHAFIRVEAESARLTARQLDAERASGGDRGPLHGMPISVKDLIDVAGLPTTAASKVFSDRVADSDAPITQRLRAAGAVLIGKTNLHEFALGTTSEDSAYGAVLHPKDLGRSAGGSSGGSAVAVAMGMGLASVGTDTGGSIRIPASACGVIGLKPSRGEVPLTGVIPLSSTFDHGGPIARSVQDAAWLWSIIAGKPVCKVQPLIVAGLRLGILDGYFATPLERAVREAFDRACERLRGAGALTPSAHFDAAPRIMETYVNVALPEGAAFHAPWLDSREADYSPAVHGRFKGGRDIPAVAYIRARQECDLMRDAIEALFSSVDALILPTMPIVAPVSGQADVTIDGTELPVRTAMLKHTQLFNMTGHPAISVPLPTDGLPVGLQIVGPLDRTTRLLDIAAACEAALCR